MAKCPNGHESEWTDYCSACGAPMGGAPDPAAAPDQSAASPVSPEVCPSCGAPRDADAPFCESCGHSFVATMPNAPPVVAPPTVPTALDNTAVVEVDRAYFDAHGAESGLQFPQPPPSALAVPLHGDEILIGRHSDTRVITPQIDLSGEHEDPAVSHRHAVLRRTPIGWTLTDLGSTNGTRLAIADAEIDPGKPVALAPRGRFYVGAWTCISLDTR
jgi:hypothetical protein